MIKLIHIILRLIFFTMYLVTPILLFKALIYDKFDIFFLAVAIILSSMWTLLFIGLYKRINFEGMVFTILNMED